jgi:uncharacterized protein YjbI with pentapeptide repeats
MDIGFPEILLGLMIVVAVWVIVQEMRILKTSFRIRISEFKLPRVNFKRGFKKLQSLYSLMNNAAQNRRYRWLIMIVFAIVVFCVFVYCFKNIRGILENNTWIPGSLITGVIAAPLAFLLWVWRDQNKAKDHEQKTKDQGQKDQELAQAERELQIKENKDAWDNFTKFQNMALGTQGEKDPVRVAAIYAIGEYYTRPKKSNFPEQVHQFFKHMLKDYWNEINNMQKDNVNHIFKNAEFPQYITSIHNVLLQKMHIIKNSVFSIYDYNLSKANLQKINLSEANLHGANLIGADLRGGNLSEVDLSGANLSEANLHGANLSKADLNGADLSKADLSEVNLIMSTICNACLINTNLRESNLREAVLDYVIMENANLRKVNLRKANAKNAVFRNVDFTEANLEEIVLIGSDLEKANLIESNLKRSILTGVSLRSACLRNAILLGANLSGADLTGADLYKAFLKEANLKGAFLENASLNEAYLYEANLKETILVGANLSGADLSYANLNEADLSIIKKWQDATWTDAKYDKNTKFPEGMNPQKLGMIEEN